MIIGLIIIYVKFVVRVGLEPTRPNGHLSLNQVRLPISPPDPKIIFHVRT